MPANFTIPLQTVIPGQLITAALWNNEYENIDTNFTPDGMDDASVNDTDFEADTDPFPGSVNSRPTSLTGELRRLRFQIRNITGKTKWQHDPDVDIATFKTRFDAHTHSGAANQGPQLGSAALQDGAVTTAKIADSNVTTAKIADSNVTDAKIASMATSKLTGTISNSQIANNAVDENKIAASVAGNGLSGGGGSPLAVNTDDSTIEKSGDALRVKDAGVTEAKLASAVVNKLGQNIGLVTIVQTSSNGDAVNYSGQGRVVMIANAGGGTISGTITIDGVAIAFSFSNAQRYLTWTPVSPYIAENAGGGAVIFDRFEAHFKTSLVVNKSAGGGTLVVAYERAA